MTPEHMEELLLDMHSSLATIISNVEHLQGMVAGQATRLGELRDLLASKVPVLEEHTHRITHLEIQEHLGVQWRAKVVGIYVGVSVAAVVVGALASAGFRLFGGH